MPIRHCTDSTAILAVINDAAEAYRGVIPPDRWHEPYMSADELEKELAAGVRFSGWYENDELLGVMGIQPVQGVTLIRHAYVRTDRQRSGIGGRLITHLLHDAEAPVLIGTWAAAAWAIRFYEKHGFHLVDEPTKVRLLRRYWDIPERQVETSVVLAR